MKSNWRRIAFLSCTHIGSTVGLWPEVYEMPDGQRIGASDVQLQILEYFNDFWTHEAAGADTIILLGDNVQGKNPKDWGLGSMTTDLDVQADVAIGMLAPHINGRKLIGVSGSKYHDSFDVKLDKKITEGLGGKFYYAMHNLKIKGPDIILNIAHGASSPTLYKATHDDRESMLMSANSMTRDIDFVARGHWHYYQYIENSRRAFLRTPGWQCWYPAKFMIEMLGKKNNKLGAVTVDFGPNRQYITYPRLYEPPQTWGEVEEI